jgi:hypothetical protein
VKVGHCQALNLMKMKPSPAQVGEGFFFVSEERKSRRTDKRSEHGPEIW